ncbi:MAG: NAD(P)H-hydrate dehydratase [Clostridiales bacterium]|nr:NAD(P)H-hydrate dehydratase [Clostridiales bacterium]
MDLISTSNMKKAEKIAYEKYGISPMSLMENAALSVFSYANKNIPNFNSKEIIVFCGSGNNGGDGYAIAKKCKLNGNSVVVYSSCQVEKLSKNAHANYHKCKDLNIPINLKKEKIVIPNDVIIIDCLLGTGLKREVSGIILEYIKLINDSQALTISVDVPSGLLADTGTPMNYAIKADICICLGKGKIGLFTQPGCEYAKNVIIKKIGIPIKVYERIAKEYKVYDRLEALNDYSIRKNISSKGDYGKVYVLAGSRGMTGAYALCTKAVLSGGAGYAYGLVPKSRIYEYNALVNEAICIEIEDNKKEYLSYENKTQIIKNIKNANSLIIGPGLSKYANLPPLISEIIITVSIPVIIDATGLRALAEDLSILNNKKATIIITPHPGEFAKLVRLPIEEVQKNRITLAKSFAKKYGIIVLLKGHKSLVTDGNTVYLNKTGNPGMATAGSGDVLAGIIGANVANTKDTIKQVAYSMYIHGLAGDYAKENEGEKGVIASLIIHYIKQVERKLYEEKTR